MERTALSKLSDLGEQIKQAYLAFSIQKDMFEFISELEGRLYAVEQDNNILKGKHKALEDKCNSLNLRYSELLYLVGERVRGSRQ